jgi:prepilin-type N-terminal cleavage/methylation domain-containing protein
MMKHRRRGFSLLEVMIVLVLLSIVMGALYLTLSNSTTTYTNRTRMGSIQDDARRVIDTMANEIRLADQATLAIGGPIPPNSTAPNSITFVIPAGFANGQVAWSLPITYSLIPSVLDPTQDSVTRSQGLAPPLRLCNYTAPTGLSIYRPPGSNNVEITLSLNTLDESGKNPLRTTVKTSVTLRNNSK